MCLAVMALFCVMLKYAWNISFFKLLLLLFYVTSEIIQLFEIRRFSIYLQRRLNKISCGVCFISSFYDCALIVSDLKSTRMLARSSPQCHRLLSVPLGWYRRNRGRAKTFP